MRRCTADSINVLRRLALPAFFFALFCPPDSSHIRPMAKNPDHPKKPGKNPEIQGAKFQGVEAGRAADRPGAGGTAQSRDQSRRKRHRLRSTGLQPPPDNSWDRRAGGEAAAHRARASTRGSGEDVAKRRFFLPLLPRATARGGEGSGVGGGSAAPLTMSSRAHPPTPPRRFAEGGEQTAPASAKRRSANSRLPITAPLRPFRRSIRNWQNSSASPPRRKTPPRWRARRATRWRRSASPPPRMRWKR